MSGLNINTNQLQSFLENISGNKNSGGNVKAENLDIKNVYIGKDNRVHVSNSGFMRWIAQKGGRATGAEAFKQALGEKMGPTLKNVGMEHASGRILDNLMKRIDGHQEKHADWSRQSESNKQLRSIGLAVEQKEPEPSVALGKLLNEASYEEIPKQQLEDAVAAGKQDAESFIKSCAGDPNPLDKLKSRLGIYENQRANAQKASELPGYKFKENKYQAEQMRSLDPKLEMARLDASISVISSEIKQHLSGRAKETASEQQAVKNDLNKPLQARAKDPKSTAEKSLGKELDVIKELPDEEDREHEIIKLREESNAALESARELRNPRGSQRSFWDTVPGKARDNMYHYQSHGIPGVHPGRSYPMPKGGDPWGEQGEYRNKLNAWNADVRSQLQNNCQKFKQFVSENRAVMEAAVAKKAFGDMGPGALVEKAVADVVTGSSRFTNADFLELMTHSVGNEAIDEHQITYYESGPMPWKVMGPLEQFVKNLPE